MKKCIVDTAAIRRNAEILKSLAGGSEIWAVVKGDGYGLGLGAMAGLLYNCGIRRFAVSEPSEAERLRALRILPRGHGVGYGSAWRAPRDTRVALCSIGYYNGFGLERSCGAIQLPLMLRRLLSALFSLRKHKALYVYVRGQRCPVLGRVGMMSCVIDVSGCGCAEGDEASADINPLMLRGFDIVFK